jgi:hypothetical protein
MNQSDVKPFGLLIKAVHDFYGKEVSEHGLGIWWESMAQFDLDAVRVALGQHCMNPDTGQFCPKPADVVKMMGGTTTDSALLAWAKVDRAVRYQGAYASVAFDDPLIHVVIMEMGGWVQLGTRSTEKEWPFKQSEFVNRYRSYRTRNEVPPYPPRLVGIFDGENASNGFKVSDENLVLIGDPEAAKRVMIGGAKEQRIGLTKVDLLGAVKALENRS